MAALRGGSIQSQDQPLVLVAVVAVNSKVVDERWKTLLLERNADTMMFLWRPSDCILTLSVDVSHCTHLKGTESVCARLSSLSSQHTVSVVEQHTIYKAAEQEFICSINRFRLMAAMCWT